MKYLFIVLLVKGGALVVIVVVSVVGIVVVVVVTVVVGSWCWCGSWLNSLDWDTATEWTGTSSVHAADEADVVLSVELTSAGHLGWHSSLEWEVGGLCAGTGVLAWDVGLDLNGLPVGTSSIGVHLAGVWSGTVTVDLVDGHVEGATSADLWELIAHHLHDCLGTGSNVVLSSTDGLSAGVGIVTLEAGGISLEWITTSSVTRSVWVNSNGGTSSTGITDSLDDSTVAGHELSDGQKTEGD